MPTIHVGYYNTIYILTFNFMKLDTDTYEDLSIIELRLIENALYQTMDTITMQSNLTDAENQHYVIDLLTKIRNAQ